MIENENCQLDDALGWECIANSRWGLSKKILKLRLK